MLVSGECHVKKNLCPSRVLVILMKTHLPTSTTESVAAVSYRFKSFSVPICYVRLVLI